MHRLQRSSRGAALMVTLILMGIVLAIVTGMLYYVNRQRARAIRDTRAEVRTSCTDSGMQLARSYFGRNFTSWNTYLNAPAVYDPFDPGTPVTQAMFTSTAFQTLHPELFADLDGDNKPDVFIWARDNPDELPPAPMNARRDNDQILVVGAICISKTMAPRRDDGTIDPNQLTAQGLLAFDGASAGYKSQASNGAAGTGNLNNF